jgi:hypothetical protein
MKYSMKKIGFLETVLAASLAFTACDSYLDIVPKGNKIPQTLADYEPLLRNEYTVGQTPVAQALYLMNDKYASVSELSGASLTRANYLWDETADRITLNNSDETTYYHLYSAISSCNLLIENVPDATECTDEERHEVIGYARVIRSLAYYVLTNFYADTYQAATAAQTLSVPLITSADIDAESEQVTLQEMYDFIINDIKTAINEDQLPAESQTVIHPNLGAAYALLSRVYLQMADYTQALQYANLALAQNDALYDWNAYYETYQSQIDNPDDYTTLPTPESYEYCENYYFRHGDNSPNYTQAEQSIPVERAARFEQGDARFLSRWKYYASNMDAYYTGIGSGYFNYGGLTTCEVYLIKAECQARAGQIQDAMNTLDQVRQTRIRPEVYQSSTAQTLAEALQLIYRTKANEMIFSIVPFADARRLNVEGVITCSFSKQYDGKTITLSPTSHLWTMPFPAGAINNTGNGKLVQNVEK